MRKLKQHNGLAGQLPKLAEPVDGRRNEMRNPPDKKSDRYRVIAAKALSDIVLKRIEGVGAGLTEHLTIQSSSFFALIDSVNDRPANQNSFSLPR